MDKEKKENTKNVENKAEPNVLIRCPKCGGGMFKTTYRQEFDDQIVQCVFCGHKL